MFESPRTPAERRADALTQEKRELLQAASPSPQARKRLRQLELELASAWRAVNQMRAGQR